MRKSSVFILAILIFTASNLFAFDQKEFVTDGAYNGKFITAGDTDPAFQYMAVYYIHGIIHCANKIDKKIVGRLYPAHTTNGQIIEAVKAYYRNNSSKPDRPIVEVVLSGCK